VLQPHPTGVATRGEGELIFNKEIVQILIDWMDGEPKTYEQCNVYLRGVFKSRNLIKVTGHSIMNCIARLDIYWRMDETQT